MTGRLEDGLGPAVRELRLRRHLSTHALARLAGISQALISKVENGRVLPSVPALYAIAEALGVGPADLLPAGGDEPVPTGHGVPLPASEAGASAPVATHLLHAAPSRRIEAYRVEHSAGHRDETPFQHSGEDIIHVLEGRVTLLYGHAHLELSTGDTMWIDGMTPHSFLTPRSTGVTALIMTARADIAQR